MTQAFLLQNLFDKDTARMNPYEASMSKELLSIIPEAYLEEFAQYLFADTDKINKLNNGTISFPMFCHYVRKMLGKIAGSLGKREVQKFLDSPNFKPHYFCDDTLNELKDTHSYTELQSIFQNRIYQSLIGKYSTILEVKGE